MVSIFREKDKTKLFNRLESRKSLASGEIAAAAHEVVDAVRREGDRALVRFTEKFDKVRLTAKRLRIPHEELRATARKIDPSLRKDMKKAIANAMAYHKRQVQKSWEIKKRDVVLGQRVLPLDSVGVYIPGGSAAYPSSVWMNVVPAKIAGVPRIVAVTPPLTFEQHPIIAAALDELGVKEVYRVGGAQAVAALAYGTASIPRVDKIVGPGNAYVTAAKREVFGEVDIDMIAGPSEIVIMATTESNPRFVAADMLSQAEHDIYACSICFTDSMPHALLVQRELEAQLAALPRKDIAKASLDNYGAIVVLDNYIDYVDWINAIAPEHLEIYSSIPQSVIGKVRHAGAIFYGDYTPEAVGDYFAGSNHVLPTTGTARFFSPLGVYHFQRKTGIIHYSKAELSRTWKSIDALAREEGLDAHARSVTIRISEGKETRGVDKKTKAKAPKSKSSKKK